MYDDIDDDERKHSAEKRMEKWEKDQKTIIIYFLFTLRCWNAAGSALPSLWTSRNCVCCHIFSRLAHATKTHCYWNPFIIIWDEKKFMNIYEQNQNQISHFECLSSSLYVFSIFWWHLHISRSLEKKSFKISTTDTAGFGDDNFPLASA